jgi:uncharacterized protein GlcG (DUF336 family)
LVEQLKAGKVDLDDPATTLALLKTARAFDMPTDELANITQPGQQGFGLNTTNQSRVVIFGGGIPIKVDGTVIGAVGASGGSVEQDNSVARAALAGMKRP